jgi:hypothetical protein
MSKYYVNYQNINQNTYKNHKFINNKNRHYNTDIYTPIIMMKSKLHIDYRNNNNIKNFINQLSLQDEILLKEKHFSIVKDKKDNEILKNILINYDIIEKEEKEEKENKEENKEKEEKEEKENSSFFFVGKIINMFKVW